MSKKATNVPNECKHTAFQNVLSSRMYVKTQSAVFEFGMIEYITFTILSLSLNVDGTLLNNILTHVVPRPHACDAFARKE